MATMDSMIAGLDEKGLTELARKASGYADLRLDGWQAQTVQGGFDHTSHLQRISGNGLLGGKPVPWSFILKTVSCEPNNTANPQASRYWKREAMFYQSGLLEDLPEGLRAPRCYGCIEHPGSYQIFLEDLQAMELGVTWPIETYKEVARQLGRFNGAYLKEGSTPSAEWIPNQWLRSYIEDAAPNMERFFETLDHPMLHRAYRTASESKMRELWKKRHELLDALESLPQTFCHQDAFCRNLFYKTDNNGLQLTAIDWSYSGPAALGSELVPLVVHAMASGGIPWSDGNQLVQLSLEGYIEGLAEMGWRGNPDMVRFALSVGITYRVGFGGMVGEFYDFWVTEALYPYIPRMFSMNVEQLADFLALGIAFFVPYFDEAMRLKKSLGL